MRSLRNALLMGLAVLGGGLVGCQNKVHDENVKLWQENREKQARLDEQRDTIDSLQNRLNAPQPAAPQAAAPTTRPAEEAAAPTPPAPLPMRESTSPTQIGGFETKTDPVAKTVTVTVPGDVLFDPGQAVVKSSVKGSLDKVVAALKQDYRGNPIQVHGHTDSDPIKRSKWKSNMELSEARAGAVRSYLVSKGIEPSQITIVGHGDQSPRSQSKAANRRVEITVNTATASAQ